MYRRRTVLMAGLCALAHGRAGAAAPPPTSTRGVLRIGTYFVNPPFEFLKEGVRIGFEVDLMHEIARRLGLEPLFVNTYWERILREMTEGRYDCIVGGITITRARERILAWSVPYLTTSLSLVVNGARTPAIEGLADLKTASVGVQAATTDYDAAVAMQKKGEIGSVKVYPFDRIGEAMADLEAGRIAAVVKVAPVAAWFVRQRPGLRVVAQVLDDPQPLGIGFGKNERALLAAVDRALEAMRRDRAAARLERKWNVS